MRIDNPQVSKLEFQAGAVVADSNFTGSFTGSFVGDATGASYTAPVLSSAAQGQAKLTTNGVAASAVDLGLQTDDSPQFTGIELGHATDTTVTRVSAGVLAVEGTTVQLHLSEGGFANGDKTKLDGIEASADATDTTNVTSAGALMDSEVSNLSLVKGLTQGISDGNVLTANDVVADDDFLRISGAEVEGLTAAEVRTALNVENGADVTDATNVTSAGALMDSELTDLAGIKGVTISTLQVKPSEGAFASGDKTKLDAIESSADVTDTANVKTALNASLGGSANIGNSSDTITIPGDLTVTGTTTTNNVTTVSTSNGVVFEGTAADGHDATLLSVVAGADVTYTLPNATGTIALTSNLASVGDGGLTQNNFTNALKTRLDGIEASATADQTASELRSAIGTGNGNLVPSEGSAGTFLKHDGTFGTPSYTTNTNTTTTSDVTSAGALMDSEVDNLAEVKAFDSTDYATAAQGTKADAALPKGGGAMTGAITTNSTFDGRDVATDGTKLDGIESSATADQTLGDLNLDTDDDVRFDSFGVGTAASGTTGEIRATGDITAYYSSDERLKENFAPLAGALDKVNQIGGYEFDWKEGIEEIVSKEGHDIGVKAQEVQAVYPELVHERDNGYLAVDYVKLTAVLIEAVKELSAKVDKCNCN
mgnify:CR=1 FL=1